MLSLYVCRYYATIMLVILNSPVTLHSTSNGLGIQWGMLPSREHVVVKTYEGENPSLHVNLTVVPIEIVMSGASKTSVSKEFIGMSGRSHPAKMNYVLT